MFKIVLMWFISLHNLLIYLHLGHRAKMESTGLHYSVNAASLCATVGTSYITALSFILWQQMFIGYFYDTQQAI